MPMHSDDTKPMVPTGAAPVVDARADRLRLVTKIVVIASAVAWIAWDVFAYLRGGNESTISRVVLEASKDWPIIPLLAGIVVGHLFFPQTPTKPAP